MKIRWVVRAQVDRRSAWLWCAFDARDDVLCLSHGPVNEGRRYVREMSTRTEAEDLATVYRNHWARYGMPDMNTLVRARRVP